MKDHKAVLNEKIKSRRVILVDSDGTKRGEFMRDDAIKIASSENLDLVLVAPGNPPICKVMDYGKYLYNQKKKSRQKDDSKRSSASNKMKEIKMTPVIDTHDFDVRLERGRKFLEKGHKVKVTVVMHGRHRKFTDQGFGVAEQFFEELSDIAQIDSNPVQSGKYITMIISHKSS